MDNKKKKIITIAFIIIIVLQLINKVYTGVKKEDLFIDEFYSYGLMNYKNPFIFQNDDFKNTWHDNEYFKEYLTIEKDELFNFAPVYNNQVNDVHPPFYYLLLRIISSFWIGTFSKWPGLILNFIIYIFAAIVLYKIADKIFKNKWYALLTVFLYGFSIFSTENTLYIRMYQLLELNILLVTYWHIKNYDKKELEYKDLITLTLLAVTGFLTHYYYILFLIGLYLVYLVKYIKNKNWKTLFKYTLFLLIAGVLILIIFPKCLEHLFLGYRGSNSIFSLTSTSLKYLSQKIRYYWNLINTSIFHFGILMFIVFAVVVKIIDIIIKLIRRKKIELNKNNLLWLITIPVAVYLAIVIKSSPFVDVRYILVVLVYILLIIVYILKDALELIIKNKKAVLIILCIVLTIATIPTFIYQNGLPYMYYGTKEILEDLRENYGDLPCIYIYTDATEMYNTFTYNYNFLLQSEQIYITTSIDYEKIRTILEQVDTSKGILLYETPINFWNTFDIFRFAGFNSYEIICDAYVEMTVYYIY